MRVFLNASIIKLLTWQVPFNGKFVHFAYTKEYNSISYRKAGNVNMTT